MYHVEWRPKAYRQLRKIDDGGTQRRIYDAVGALANWPCCSGVKALRGRGDYRLRVGRWRVIFEVLRSVRIISIEEVKKRNERTYD